MTDEGEKAIIMRLNVIINLLTKLCIDKKLESSVKEQIGILHEIGLSSGDIGRILGKGSGYITSNLSRIKRGK
jgi:hypothetical protein